MNFKIIPVKPFGLLALFIIYACASYAHYRGSLAEVFHEYKVTTDLICSVEEPESSDLRLEVGMEPITEVIFTVGKFEYLVLTDRPNAVIVTKAFEGYYDTSLTVPKSVEWGGETYVVIGVGRGAFSGIKVKEIFLPETIETLGERAFYYCDQLENIYLPSRLISIEAYAFQYCRSLVHMELPARVNSIGNNAFEWCQNLLSIELPQGVKSIGDNAFGRCNSLQSVVLPDSLEFLGKDAFYECESLEAFTISDTSPYFSTIDGILYDKSQTLLVLAPKTVEYVTLKDGVSSIGEDAFYACERLKKIIFPKSLVTIGDGAFNSCQSLTEIEFPDSLVFIGNGAFGYCKSLSTIKLPEGLRSIGVGCFSLCDKLKSVRFPSTLSYLGPSAFSNCYSLSEAVWSDKTEHLEILDKTFLWCTALKFIHVPAGLQIETGAFLGCSRLEAFTVDEDNPYHVVVDGMLFNKECTVLIEYAGTNGNVILPEGLLEIGSTMWDNPRLYSVSIPNTVIDIGCHIGWNCTKLYKIVCLPLTPPKGFFDLRDDPMGEPIPCSIYVPEQSLELYRQKWPGKRIYPIRGTGVDAVESVLQETDSAPYTVYSLDGRLVSVATDAESLHALPSGIYIVNGKKMIVP